MTSKKIAEIFAGVRNLNRRSIGKAITLIESTKNSDSKLAEDLLTSLMPFTGNALKIGISGIPGVGKSTFIEEFGSLLINQGKKVAVLAVDPSSPVTGGSIMGDKTRMEQLAANENAFVRPSPAGENSGGVARKTREASLVVDAAGYDVILIETVGVGQSEIAVASMVDAFLVLQMPSTGDELQSIKKGILEIADIIAINKADGDLKPQAIHAVSNHKKAYELIKTHSNWIPPVLMCSALEKSGISEIWDNIETFVSKMKTDHLFESRRKKQAGDWFDSELSLVFSEAIKRDSDKTNLKNHLRQAVINKEIAPTVAARKLLFEIMK